MRAKARQFWVLTTILMESLLRVEKRPEQRQKQPCLGVSRLKALSAQTGLTVAELVRRAIDAYIAKEKHQ